MERREIQEGESRVLRRQGGDTKLERNWNLLYRQVTERSVLRVFSIDLRVSLVLHHSYTPITA